MTSRRQRTTKQRLAIFEAHQGICHICGTKIKVGERWDLEHVVPLAIGGEDTDGNLRPAHSKCHKAKTKEDATTIAKSNRVRAKHLGAGTKSTMPGSKTSKWKKTVNNGWVLRDQP